MCPSSPDFSFAWGPSPCDLFAPVEEGETIKRDDVNQFLAWSGSDPNMPTREKAEEYLNAKRKAAMDKAGQHFIESILIQVRPRGIAPDLEGPFLLWIGNECWEGREPEDFLRLIARAPELAKRFLAEESRKGLTKPPAPG